MKNIAPFIIGGAVMLAIGVGVVVLYNRTTKLPAIITQQEKGKQTVTGGAESIINVVPDSTDAGVPLLTEEDIIRTFFTLIDEGKPSEVVFMMSKATTENDSYKQAWAVQFNAFKSVILSSVEPGNEAGWTDTIHIYKVTVNAVMKEKSKNEVIPYLGWENGENTRWVELIREESGWRVQGIATGA